MAVTCGTCGGPLRHVNDTCDTCLPESREGCPSYGAAQPEAPKETAASSHKIADAALRDIAARNFGVSGWSSTAINKWFNERAYAALEGRKFEE